MSYHGLTQGIRIQLMRARARKTASQRVLSDSQVQQMHVDAQHKILVQVQDQVYLQRRTAKVAQDGLQLHRSQTQALWEISETLKGFKSMFPAKAAEPTEEPTL